MCARTANFMIDNVFREGNAETEHPDMSIVQPNVLFKSSEVFQTSDLSANTSAWHSSNNMLGISTVSFDSFMTSYLTVIAVCVSPVSPWTLMCFE